MKAIIAAHGSNVIDPGAFSVKELPLPEPGARDLLVKIIAVGMNPVDTKFRRRMASDGVLGWDAWGVVEETGSDVAGFKAGDRVFYAGDITRPGCDSEFHLVDHRLAALAPRNLTPEDAVAMPLTSITAWECLFDKLGFTPEAGANAGNSILIIGGAGGVGSVAIQLARWAGLQVYATASRKESADWCLKLGAGTILDHGESLHEQLQKTGKKSIDAIFCTTRMEAHWQAMADCIRPGGDVVFIDDPVDKPDIRIFKQKSVTLSWEFMFTRSMFQTPDMASQGQLLATVAALLDQGHLVSTRQKTVTGLTPESIRAMHSLQESGTMIGKQVLLVKD